MEIASETLSLTWWQIVLFKVIKNTSETRYSLDAYGVDYLMDMFEYISFDEYMTALQHKSSIDFATQKQKVSSIVKSLPK